MEKLFDLAGMALDLRELKDPDRPKGLVTARVDSRDKLRAWAHAFGEGFGLPKGSQASIVELIGAAWEESGGKWRHYVGTLDGDPVGSSSMYLDRGVAGLYFVGTVPAARQRGIGTWMTSLPLKEARELGVRLSVLHAAPKAQPLYRRLGFKEYCQLGLYRPSFMDWAGFPPEKA
jgi:ribosomal protein S18 acetylase RimI-like enzyme